MSALNEAKTLVMGLSRVDRCALSEWLSEEIGEKWGVEEPRASYGPAVQQLRALTIEEFLAFEGRSTIWHEYVAGEVYALATPSQAHEIIVSHLAAEIDAHLRRRPCRSYRGSRHLQFRAHGEDIVYRPDIWVACGRDRDAQGEFIDEPRLVVEVLSPSTERTDRREKSLYYREIPTLEEIVFVSQLTARITVLRRAQRWAPTPLIDIGDVLVLESVSLSIPLQRIFEGLP